MSHLLPTTSPLSIGWPDLLLDRTMITGLCPAYVGRFACDWHRLTTTDPIKANGHIIIHLARKGKPFFRIISLFCHVPDAIIAGAVSPFLCFSLLLRVFPQPAPERAITHLHAFIGHHLPNRRLPAHDDDHVPGARYRGIKQIPIHQHGRP